jgi:hypothetical protein
MLGAGECLVSVAARAAGDDVDGSVPAFVQRLIVEPAHAGAPVEASLRLAGIARDG